MISSLPAVAGIERVGPDFLIEFARMIDRLGWGQEHADMVASLISHESGFRPDIVNAMTGKHVGLIQFSPGNYTRWGYSLDQVKAMTATEQLALVERYFAPLRSIAPRDIAMAGLGWGVGMDDGVIVWSKDGTMGMRDDVQPKGYAQNPGLDRDKDGLITLGEIRADVAAPLARAASRPRIPIPEASSAPAEGGGTGEEGGGFGLAALFGLALLGLGRLFRRRRTA